MSYVNKRIQSLINHADVCGGGMKKSGLVYGSDWARLNSNTLKTIPQQAAKNPQR